MGEIDEFKLYLLKKTKPTTLTTVKVYCQLLKYLLRTVSPFTAENFKNFVTERLLADGNRCTLNNYIKIAKHYSTMKALPGFEDVKILEVYDNPGPTMSDDEVRRFLRLKKIGKQTRDRYELWHMFWELFYRTGARPNEIATLRVQNFNFSNWTFIIKKTDLASVKNKTGRVVPVPTCLRDSLQRYVNNLESDLLFPRSLKRLNEPIYQPHWSHNFHMRLKALKINRELTPYCLRRSHITPQIEEDTNLYRIKTYVGHKNIATTERYYRSCVKNLRKAIDHLPLNRPGSGFESKLEMFTELINSLNLGDDKSIRYEQKITLITELLTALKLHNDKKIEYDLSQKGGGLIFNLKPRM